MIQISRKEQLAVLKWCRQHSPIGTLVFSMNGKWSVPNQNNENIIANFLRYWKTAKGAIIIQGKKRLEAILIPVPDPEKYPSVQAEFINLLLSMPERFKNTECYEELESFSRDMKSLFMWDKPMEDVWVGYILTALDGQEKTDACNRLFIGHEDSETIVSMYSSCLLKRCDVQKATTILEPFRESTDEDIQKRFELLRKLQSIKSYSSCSCTFPPK